MHTMNRWRGQPLRRSPSPGGSTYAPRACATWWEIVRRVRLICARQQRTIIVHYLSAAALVALSRLVVADLAMLSWRAPRSLTKTSMMSSLASAVSKRKNQKKVIKHQMYYTLSIAWKQPTLNNPTSTLSLWTLLSRTGAGSRSVLQSSAPRNLSANHSSLSCSSLRNRHFLMHQLAHKWSLKLYTQKIPHYCGVRRVGTTRWPF